MNLMRFDRFITASKNTFLFIISNKIIFPIQVGINFAPIEAELILC